MVTKQTKTRLKRFERENTIADIPRIQVDTTTHVVSLKGEARATRLPDATYMDVLKRSPLHYERIVDPREQGYRIVSVQQVKKFAISYWRDGVLEHRVLEATSADEAALLLDKEVETEEQNRG